MAKIIVISDIHHSVSKFNDVYDQAHLNDKLTEGLSENIYDLLYNALSNEKDPADLLIFCGDYVIGAESTAEKNKALNQFVQFLEKIEESEEIMSEGSAKCKRIIIVPGNHDIVRGSKAQYNQFKSALSRYCTPFTNKHDCESVPTFIFDDYKLIVDCETTEDAASTKNKKVAKFEKALNTTRLGEKTKKDLISIFKEDAIVDVPSVSAEAVKRFHDSSIKISADSKYNDYLKILVTHRALISSIELGKPIKQYSATIGGYDFMKSAMEYDYKLFIHGHIHQKSCVEITDYGNDNPRTAVQLGIPALERNDQNKGIVVVNTDSPGDNPWPFTVIYKSLSSFSQSFRQTSVLEGKKNKAAILGDGVRILVDKEITEIIDEGKIIVNGDRDRVEAASYDCALGYHYKRLIDGESDWSKIKVETLGSSGETAEIVVKPHETVLIFTYEEFNVPDNMVMHASAISSLLRKGIRVEYSHFVDPGFQGAFCFPVINESEEDVHISSREPILSIELIQLPQACEKGWAERHQEKKEKRKRLEE